MQIWMKHDEHGVQDFYDATTVKENEKNGWAKMTREEVEARRYSPKRPGRPRKVDDDSE